MFFGQVSLKYFLDFLNFKFILLILTKCIGVSHAKLIQSFCVTKKVEEYLPKSLNFFLLKHLTAQFILTNFFSLKYFSDFLKILTHLKTSKAVHLQ